jgi:osmotically-inducible protein OsmY
VISYLKIFNLRLLKIIGYNLTYAVLIFITGCSKTQNRAGDKIGNSALSSTEVSPNFTISKNSNRATLAKKLAQRVKSDEDLIGLDITITSQKNGILIEGEVEDEEDLQKLIEMAESIEEVENVSTDVVVTSPADNFRVKTDVANAINSVKIDDKSKVSFTVQDGTVILKGKVFHIRTLDSLLTAVLMVNGVAKVENQVEVEE